MQQHFTCLDSSKRKLTRKKGKCGNDSKIEGEKRKAKVKEINIFSETISLNRYCLGAKI